MGAIFIAAILLILTASGTDFFKGSIKNIPNQTEVENTPNEPGSVIVEYVKIPEKNEISIGSKQESLGKYLFKIAGKIKDQTILIEALTFEMEGDFVKENFENITIKIGDKTVENVEFNWGGNASLLCVFEDEIELKGDVDIELLGDIKTGTAGQMFAFHFVGLDAVSSGIKVESIGVNGSATPMPQIHILK